MRLLMLPILFVVPMALSLGACDRAKVAPDQEQAPEQKLVPAQNQADIAPNAQTQMKTSPKKPVAEERVIKSSGGIEALLSTKFAGSPAPTANFTGADGRDVALSDFGGRPLLVNIWATWCAPCKAEMPMIDRLVSEQEGRISVIAVSQDLEGRAPVRAFFNAAGIKNLEPYIDRDLALSAAYGSNMQLPTTILYDSDGREVWRVTGAVEWSEPAIMPLLNEAD
jgi:thiol-disulfide isomerase/thioredoxin